MECYEFEKANYDISIEGLGWISVQGKGFVDMFLNLPFGIKYHVRKDPMRPYFIKDNGGLDRYTGMTVGAKTKMNKKLS
jgi:hypothetical protein